MLPMRLLDIKESKRQFCSRLVALSYQYAAFDLKNLRDPRFCSPRQLSLCKAFRKIEDVVRQAEPAEVAFAQTPDPVTKNLTDTYEWLDKVRGLVNADIILSQSYDIQAQNDVSELVLHHPELDKIITGFMRNTDYLTFFDHDRTVNTYRYDRKAMLIKLKEFPFNAGDFLQEELSKEPSNFLRFERNINATIHHISLKRLEYFIEHLRLYRKLMNEVFVRLEVIAFGFDLIGETESAKGVGKLAMLTRLSIKQADHVLGQ
jgi:hypothetical protein